jgi:hypothetical protein
MGGYISDAGAAAIKNVEDAGYVAGPEWLMGMIALRRRNQSEPRIWLDVGDTVRLSGHDSDIGYTLFFEIVNLLDGPEAVKRARTAWNMPIPDGQ